ncbi:MAG: heparinase II/III-family protein [Planctomycetaceae bacterium]|jgi:hypothetical protein|nr:heparinase II/III-family protein [Planctomycetaceae bacterium]
MFRSLVFCCVSIILFSAELSGADDAKVVLRNRKIEARAGEVVLFLAKEPFCVGRRVGDRAAWGLLQKSNIIKDAEKLLNTPIPELPEALYKEYYRNGNRTNYQNVRSQKYRRIAVFVLAECIEDKGRFIAPLEETIRSICADPSWTLPAHDRNAEIYDGKAVYIDLVSSDTSVELGLAVSWLGEKLSRGVRELIYENVERRTLRPYEQAVKSGNIGRNWWITGGNNWNSVCHANVVGAVLALVGDTSRRAWYIAAAETFMQPFLNGFTEDGYCSEGIGYWNYGFGHFVDLSEMVHQATGGKVDFLTMPKVKNCALFGVRMEVVPGKFAAFADCAIDAKPSPSLVKFLSRRFQFGFTDYENYQDKLSNLKSTGIYCFPNSATNTPPNRKQPTPLEDLRTEFPNAGVMIFRPRAGETKQIAVACKGGHNAEQHNHNDVGSFTVMFAGGMQIIDPGGEIYTQRTFSNKRYQSNLLNSFGHSVPVINGQQQKSGNNTNAKIIAKMFSDKKDSCTINYAAAYGLKELKKLERTFELTRADADEAGRAGGTNVLTVTDEVELETAGSFETALITYDSWDKKDVKNVDKDIKNDAKDSNDSAKDSNDDGAINLTIGKEGQKLRVIVTAFVDDKILPLRFEASEIDEDAMARKKPTRLAIKIIPKITKAKIITTITPL